MAEETGEVLILTELDRSLWLLTPSPAAALDKTLLLPPPSEIWELDGIGVSDELTLSGSTIVLLDVSTPPLVAPGETLLETSADSSELEGGSDGMLLIFELVMGPLGEL